MTTGGLRLRSTLCRRGDCGQEGVGGEERVGAEGEGGGREREGQAGVGMAEEEEREVQEE